MKVGVEVKLSEAAGSSTVQVIMLLYGRNRGMDGSHTIGYL